MQRILTIVAVFFAVSALAGCQTMTGRTAGTYIDDNTTTAAVKSKLVAERIQSLTSVGVETVNGVVYLTGVVATPQERLRAQELAWDTKGVRQVVNNVQVQAATAPVPAGQQAVVLPPAPGTATASPGTVAASPATVARHHMTRGTISSIDRDRNQAWVKTRDGDFLMPLPAATIRDLRVGDEITFEMNLRPVR